MTFTTRDIVAESNRIEGIEREPTPEEIAAHDLLVSQEIVSIEDLRDFVQVYQPDANLRDHPGMNVRVGDHVPPPGGPHIRARLYEVLLIDDPWEQHVAYETLHPFTDGNGRSGRVLWYWAMRNDRMYSLGFLHAFYYQTLRGQKP